MYLYDGVFVFFVEEKVKRSHAVCVWCLFCVWEVKGMENRSVTFSWVRVWENRGESSSGARDEENRGESSSWGRDQENRGESSF